MLRMRFRPNQCSPHQSLIRSRSLSIKLILLRFEGFQSAEKLLTVIAF